MRLSRLLLPLAAAFSVAAVAQEVSDDPYIWLEEKDSPRALAWVKAHNAPTLKLLENDPRYATLYAEALAIAAAKDRIPMPSFVNGRIFNFWQDAEHLRGIWRATTAADYRSANPTWKTVLDIDALGKAEGKSWVWKGANCHEPEERRCLVSLSEGGEDAIELREFDVANAAFVAGGFSLPRSQTTAAWENADRLLVATDWSGKGDDLTESEYPYIVKRLDRGAPMSAAVEIFRGEKSDVGTFPQVLRDGQGRTLTLLQRAIDFFRTRHFVVTPGGARQLAIPEKATVEALVAGRVIVKLEEDWAIAGPAFKAGTLASLDLAQVLRDPGQPKATLVWAPGPRDALEEVATTRNRLLLRTLDNVRGRLSVLTPAPGGKWITRRLALPANHALDIVAADDRSERAFVSVAGFLDPSALYAVDAASGALAAVKTLPAKFDASNHVVEQLEATSSDGTKVPYFVVRRKDVALTGETPTLLTAYGGFQISNTPAYSGTIGKLWLERGGAFVLANIRGGGEFGPAWHQAGLGAKRQIIYDDFEAVARDLIARKLTSPRRLGIYGGSNGGLLVGVQMIQNPELYNAINIQIPLLDMIRIAKIARGASWQGEYGDVAKDPAIRAFWDKTSPYQNLRRDGRYPEPFIFTTTRDDRTGPQHARKFAARMEEYGLPFLYYEHVEGGHGSGADLEQTARTNALTYTYFMRKLMD